MPRMRFLISLCVLVLFLPLPARAASNRDALILYTAITATTPQIPLWAAINTGWPEHGGVTTEYWKTLDDLRGIILAGKGDIWVGHLEGFAQAALRGAPVTLIAVTGWKKFYFVTPQNIDAGDLQSLADTVKKNESPLAVAPQDSPALAILETVQKRGGPAFSIAAMQPQQLMLEMLRGTRAYALLPEPLVSSLVAKKPTLRVSMSLEKEFARLYGGPERLPLVGVAVNRQFAEHNPQSVRMLVNAMKDHGERLAGDGEAALAVLPETVKTTVGMDILRASLARDVIHAAPAAEVRDEIASFLRMVLPDTPPANIDALLQGPFLFRGQ